MPSMGMGGSFGGFGGLGAAPGFNGAFANRRAQTTPLTDPTSGTAVTTATGTGQAFNLSISTAPSVGRAAGTGAAFDVFVSGPVNVGVATGTGTAYNIGVSPGLAIDIATGTGQAFDLTLGTVNVQSFQGMILGITHFPTPGPGFRPGFMARRPAPIDFHPLLSPYTNVDVGSASGSGAAFDVQIDTGATFTFPGRIRSVGVGQMLAPGFGSINQKPATKPVWDFTTISVVVVGMATGTGQAFDLTTAAAGGVGVATGTGTAYDITISTADVPDVNVGRAAGTGAAFNISPSVKQSVGSASGTGTAYSLTAAAGVSTVGIGQGSGAAYDITVKVSVAVDIASGTGSAFNILFSTGNQLMVGVGLASGEGTAYNLVGQVTTYTWFGPTALEYGPIAMHPRDSQGPVSQRLFSHYRARERGRNVYILMDGTVTEDRPTTLYDNDGVLQAEDEEQIARTLFGGHVEYLTPEEAALLVDAGYGSYIEQTVMTPA